MHRSVLDMQIDAVTWADVEAFLAQDEPDMRRRPPEGARLEYKMVRSVSSRCGTSSGV